MTWLIFALGALLGAVITGVVNTRRIARLKAAHKADRRFKLWMLGRTWRREAVLIKRLEQSQLEHTKLIIDAEPDVCQVPPPGWCCTRKPGHGGPCAAERERVYGA